MKRHITNIISSSFGKFASHNFTPFIQNFINKSYINLLKLDMSDFEEPSSYNSLNALFTRKLKRTREFNNNENTLICPTDSFITDLGEIKNDKLTQIKGMTYSFKEMLSNSFDNENLKKIENGSFINFYLSPKDYHRYHSPTDMRVSKLVYIPAKLYPVNNRYLNKKENLFVENERVILECLDGDNELFYMVFVGALNVGKIVINFEDRVKSNAQELKKMIFNYDDVNIKKGEELGYFMMGSTVVIVFQKDYGKIVAKLNSKIKFGDDIIIKN